MNDGFVALTKCYFCGEANEILLNRRLGRSKAIVEADGKVIDMRPCAKCEKYMHQGIILITIDSSRSDPGWDKPDKEHWMPNPYRTGGFFVVTESFVQRVLQPKAIADYAIDKRWMFIEDEAARALGLFEVAEVERSG
jgi:hypothetical protein